MPRGQLGPPAGPSPSRHGAGEGQGHPGPRAHRELTRGPLPLLRPQRVSRAVEHAAPWLVLAGSGGVADVLAALVGQPRLLAPQLVEQQFKEKFPGEHFSWEDIVHWTGLVGAPQAPRPSGGRPSSHPTRPPFPGGAGPGGGLCAPFPLMAPDL